MKKKIDERAEATKYGTEFPTDTVQNNTWKSFGLGFAPAFIGAAGKPTTVMPMYSLLHRYYKYKRMKLDGYKNKGWATSRSTDWDEDYYGDYYSKKRCLDGCPSGTHCEWGFCECNEGFVKMYGQCWKRPGNNQDDLAVAATRLTINPTLENTPCQNTTDCANIDINFICIHPKFGSETDNSKGNCQCRRDMEWNAKMLECQIKITADCSKFSTTSPVSPLVARAAQALEKRVIQSKENEKKELERKRLEICKKYKCDRSELGKLDENGEVIFLDLRLCWVLSCEVLPKCPKEYGKAPVDAETSIAEMKRTHYYQTLGTLLNNDSCDPFYEDYYYTIDHLSYRQLRPLSREYIDKNRTETFGESMESSLLFEDFSTEDLTEENLDELFCRDIDAYSFVMEEIKPSQNEYCGELDSSHCARLYDSERCHDGWSLNITDNTDQSLYYFSWYKYRNDADVVGVAPGCTFTAFTGIEFSGEELVIAAGPYERWIRFADKNSTKFMDENLLSFKCSCRKIDV